MSGITKKVTTSCKHRNSQLIKVIQFPEGYSNAVILFAQASASGGQSEQRLPMSDKAWARAARGAGAKHEPINKGVVGLSRYRFVIFSEEDPEVGELVTGIHCVPVDNYLGADFSPVVGSPVAPESAVVYVHDTTGELDVVAYPVAFRRTLDSFVKHLESLEKIDEFTTFTEGGVTFTVSSMMGNEVTFRCRKQQS